MKQFFSYLKMDEIIIQIMKGIYEHEKYTTFMPHFKVHDDPVVEYKIFQYMDKHIFILAPSSNSLFINIKDIVKVYPERCCQFRELGCRCNLQNRNAEDKVIEYEIICNNDTLFDGDEAEKEIRFTMAPLWISPHIL